MTPMNEKTIAMPTDAEQQEAFHESVDEGKYVVFKRDEFFQMMGALALPPYHGQTSTGRQEMAGKHWDCAAIAQEIQRRVSVTELHDAVVIRRRDVFAAPALEAYANAIQCVIDAVGKGSSIDGTSIQGLRDIADYFHEQSEKSYNDSNRKLPD